MPHINYLPNTPHNFLLLIELLTISSINNQKLLGAINANYVTFSPPH